MSEDAIRWDIEARGSVQKVGYRAFVEGVARRLGLVGSVENDKADSSLVRVIAQGPAARLEQFVKAITGEHGIINAESVRRVSDGPTDSSLTAFRQVRGESLEELGESGEASVQILGHMWESMKSGNQEILGAVREGNASLGKKVDGVGRAVIEGNRSLGSKMDRVAKAVGDQGRSTSQFHHDLAFAVSRMDTKYGAISKTLLRIDKDLQAQTKALVQVARAMDRTNRLLVRGASRSATSTPKRKRVRLR